MNRRLVVIGVYAACAFIDKQSIINIINIVISTEVVGTSADVLVKV